MIIYPQLLKPFENSLCVFFFSDCFVGFTILQFLSFFLAFGILSILLFYFISFCFYYLVSNVKLLLMVYKLFKEFFCEEKRCFFVFFSRYFYKNSCKLLFLCICIFTSFCFADCNFAAIYLLLVFSSS